MKLIVKFKWWYYFIPFFILKRFLKAEIMEEKEFDCPRMNGNTQFGKAVYKKSGNYRCCSHCGSMHPDDVIKAVKEFGSKIIGSTTKSYKRYIDLPGVANAKDGPIKFYTQHFSKEQIEEFNSLVKND